MNQRQKVNTLSPKDFNFFNQALRIIFVLLSFLLIIIATLSPYNFSLKEIATFSDVIDRFDVRFLKPGVVGDWLRNCCLFMPFGFGLARLFEHKISKKLLFWGGVLISSAGISLAVEILQVFLPSRSPTLMDIFANTVGGIIGVFAFYLNRFFIENYIIKFLILIKKIFSFKKLLGLFLTYIILIILIITNLQNQTNLGDWNPNFPLVIGNEPTGTRPWNGAISQLQIANQALSDLQIKSAFTEKSIATIVPDFIIGSYQFSGQGEYPDQTGNLPALVWQRRPPKVLKDSAILLNSNHWLSTAKLPIFLTEKIRETSQFTFSLILKTLDTQQTGPARIISLSTDTLHRNLTLGQSQNKLIVRLRTPITGENGDQPELMIPGVFAEQNFHHLIITYDGVKLQVYVDQREFNYSISLTPEITLFRYFLLPFSSYGWKIDIHPVILSVYKILFYGIVLIPLGFLVACMRPFFRFRSKIYVLVLTAIILIPSLLIEGVLALGSHRNFSGGNILLSMMIAGITIFLVGKKQNKLTFLMNYSDTR